MATQHVRVLLEHAKDHVEKRWFTQKDAAEYLGVSEQAIKQWRLSGKLPYFQPNAKLVFVERKDLDKFIIAHKFNRHA